ncbi:MAG: hypothetical protein K9L30_17085 [Desulfobacterales bacterium]|nr:hypothetical protein [Desulfobacterales bacterium]
MSHHHEHDHGEENSLTESEKLIKLLEHWIHHNDDHAENYRNWASKAKDSGLTDVEGFLKEAAEKTMEISTLFKKAKGCIK